MLTKRHFFEKGRFVNTVPILVHPWFMNQTHDIFGVFGNNRPHGALDDRTFADSMAPLLIKQGRKRWTSLLWPEYERRMRQPRIGSDTG